MMKLHLLTLIFLFTLPVFVWGQSRGDTYLLSLNDAQLDIGLKTVTVFALDDRATLHSNPHFQAMWNLIQLGSSIEALLHGTSEPLNDLNLGKKYGQNGYNKTVIQFFMRYGFGESSDVALQQHFIELGISPGYFKEGNKGMHLHLEYQMNLLKTQYGAGGGSLARTFDHEFYIGGRLGFDWSFGRSEGETGFFAHLNDEIQRIADENEFTASQLIRLQELAESSKVLLPEDVGGRALHIGPIVGGRLSKKVLKHGQLFLNGTGFYDLMDLSHQGGAKENKRSQHQVNISLGLQLTIGGDGNGLVAKGFF
ncbi:MAG: hypothetical protein IPJ74_23760 [Saprospiraceae bacterium]|nr:hypothetical protein [Saprospiraceae bacterium]